MGFWQTWRLWFKSQETPVRCQELTSWKCPECGAPLEKRKDTGEHSKHCTHCGCGWFILKTSTPRKEK